MQNNQHTHIQASTLHDLQLLDQWFERVLDASEPEACLQGVLQEIDASYPHLKARFLDLLCADDESQWSWEQGHFQLMPALTQPLELHPGDQIDAWTIVAEVGRGGMGVVYEVEREHKAQGSSFTQRGALKLITTPKLVLPGQSLHHERFLREMATLSSLAEHPNIAQFLDAGTTADDQPTPYFVMEFIDGKRLDTHCNDKQLTIPQRVTLFLDVVRAVHFMHLRGVIHRDLKPQNILVTDQGHCKVLDLGIAQSTTGQDVQAYTPTWASPEQLNGQPVTTSSDIYNLGLLLLALVWGDHEQSDMSVTWRTRMQTLDTQQLQQLATQRGYVSAKQWRGQLSMELQAILSRALAAQPHDRYASAQALAIDLEHWLNGQPINALVDQRGYMFWYTLRRHRFILAASIVIVLVLIGWSISLVAQNQTIEREKKRVEAARLSAQREAMLANELSLFMQKMLVQSNPSKSGYRGQSLEDVLNQSAQALQSQDVLQNPRIKATLLRVMADAYMGLGRRKKAEALLDQARTLTPVPKTFPCKGSGSAMEPARLAFSQAKLLYQHGKIKEARAAFTSLLERCEKSSGQKDHEDLRIATHLKLGSIFIWHMEKDNKFGYQHYNQARILSEDNAHPEAIEGLIHALVGMSLGETNWPKHHDKVNKRIERALKLADRVWHANHPDRAQFYNQLYFADPNPVRRFNWTERSVEIAEKTYGKDHLFVGHLLNDFALSVELTDLQRAIRLMRRSHQILKKHYPLTHPLRLSISINYASMLVVDNQLDEAQEILEAYYAVSSKATVISNLALLRKAQGRYDEAIALNRQLLKSIQSAKNPLIERIIVLNVRLAMLYELNDQPELSKQYMSPDMSKIGPSRIKLNHLLYDLARVRIRHAARQARQTTTR